MNTSERWQCVWCGKWFGKDQRPKHDWGRLTKHDWGRLMWFCSDYCKNGRRDP